MADNPLFEVYLDRIGASDFHDPLHRQIFTVASRLVAEGKPANSATIGGHLTELSPIPDLTVPAYMRELNKFIRGRDEIEAYISEVKLASKRRAVLEVAERFAAMAYTAGHDVIDRLSGDVALLASGNDHAGMVHMGPSIDDAYQRILANDDAGWGPTGYCSGFPEIDAALGGFKRSKLYYLTAMEKAGKSACMLSIARRFLLQDIPVAIFSLEMKKEEISDRMIMLESEISTVNRPQGMRLTEEERERLSIVADRCNTWPWYSNDLASLTPAAIKIGARHTVRVHGVRVIFVDYVQIVESDEDDRKRDDNRRRVEKASRAMAQMAKELDVCVIALAQLNRKPLERASAADWRAFESNAARPRRGDMRETAQIEMDADGIIAIYRPEIIFREMRPFETASNVTELLEFDNELSSFRGKAELSVLLNRSGPSSVRCDCRFRENIMRFDPLKSKATP